MTVERGIGWARGIGFALGLAVAIAAVVGWALPRGNGRLGADVVIGFLQTGELHISAPAATINAPALYPGGGAGGSVRVRNIGPSPLSVRVQAQPSIGDLDRLLWIDVAASGRRIFRGPVGELRDGSHGRFTIASGQARTIDVRTWLPSSVDGGYEGRIEQVNLTFDPEVVRR